MTNTTHPTATITREQMIAWLDKEIAEHRFYAENITGSVVQGGLTEEAIDHLEAIRDALSTPTIPAVPEGYVLVPVEPSEEMFKAAMAAYTNDYEKLYPDHFKRVWKAMISSLPAPPSNGGWRPIEEAPKDGTEILGYASFSHKNGGWIGVCCWLYVEDEGQNCWSSVDDPTTEPLTHFMPLPAPPKER